MLSKKDIKLIGEFCDKKNPKLELCCALVGRGGIFATDGLRAIKFHFSELTSVDEVLVHKKLLKGFEGLLGKNDHAELLVGASGVSLEFNKIALSLDTATFEFKYPDSERILDQKLGNHFVLSDLNDIIFELSQRSCFIEWAYVAPLVEHGEADKYDIFYSPQSDQNAGMLKVVASVEDREEGTKILYTAVVMGRTFQSEAK